MQYYWSDNGSTPSAWGEPDLRQALGKLFTSSSHNKGHASSYSDYFQDILHSASNLDWEFRRLDLMFSSKVDSTFQMSKNPPKHSVDDLAHLHQSVKGVLKLIRNLKEDLKLTEHLYGMDRHKSLPETKFVIKELEAKLHELMSYVDEIKTQLPVEFGRWESTIPKLKNLSGEEELLNRHPLNSGHTPNRHHHSQRIGCKNDLNKTIHDMNRNEKFEKPKCKTRVKSHELNGMEEMRYKKTHCSKGKKLKNHSFHELQGEQYDENPHCLKQMQYQNHCSDELQTSKKQCKKTICSKQPNLKHFSFDEVQQNRLSAKDPHCLKPKQCLRRPKHNEDPSGDIGDHQSVMQLYMREPFDVKSSMPYIYRVDGFKDDNKNKSINDSSYISENDHTRDVKCKKKKARRKRERTRAGKDFERIFRSESDIYWKNNEFRGVNSDVSNNGIVHVSEYLNRDYNNFSNSFRANDYGERRGIFGDRKMNEIILSDIRCKPDGVERWGRRGRRRRERTKQSMPRLDGGAQRSMFNVRSSPKMRRKLRRRDSEKKRKRYVTWKPNTFRMSVDSSRPYRRRYSDNARRRRRKKGSFRRPQYITYRQEFASESNLQRGSMLYFTQSDHSMMRFEGVEFCHSFPTSLKQPCPTDCCYPCCAPQYVRGYRPIPYPMCSNTCCTVRSPVPLEQFRIQFERPRKKKIVKRYLPVRDGERVYYKLELESQYSTPDIESQWGNYMQLEESKSCTNVCYRPIETECQSYKYYKESVEKETEYDRFECEPPPVEDTCTEILSTEDTFTSFYEIIRAVKAVATNTTSVATRDTGISTDIETLSPLPETRNKQTNTEKMMRRSVGTETNLKSSLIMTDKATSIPQLKKRNRETNTVQDKAKKVKDTGTNPRPEERKKVTDVGIGTAETKVESKFTNTIPMQTERKRMPSTVSKGTQVLPVVAAAKQTSYDKVRTRDDATDPIPTKMIHKDQQFEYEDPFKTKATLTEQTFGHKQFLESQYFENLQTLLKQPVGYVQNLTQNPSPQIKKNSQSLKKQSVGNVQKLDNQPVKHLQSLGKTQIKQFQTLDKPRMENLQIIIKQPIRNLQYLSKQPVKTQQTITKQLKHHTVTEKVTDKSQTFRGPTVKDFERAASPLPPLRPPPAGGFTIGAALPADVNSPSPQTAKKTEQPVQHVQVLSKNPRKHTHTLSVQKLACLCDRKPKPKRAQVSGEKPMEDGMQIAADNRNHTALFTTQLGEPRQEEVQEEESIFKCPSDCLWVVKESSSDMSVYLTVEKIHEEVFRKICRYCKCSKQCRCKCCNTTRNDRKIIVCEKKKSNTIRITNKSECKILQEGEEVASDVDVEMSFNVGDSRSEADFTRRVNEDPMEPEPDVLCGKRINAYYKSMTNLSTSAYDICEESGGDWKYTNY